MPATCSFRNKATSSFGKSPQTPSSAPLLAAEIPGGMAPGTAAGFFTLKGLGIDKDDNVDAAEWLEEQVRKITPDAVVTHFNTSGYYRQCEDLRSIARVTLTPPTIMTR